ncbi:MAG: hypothetical protein NWF05_02025 [Candidatus Bathyarchaeota archaeon]|nr:hypothetical protein [Candidatus Bathyarchaeota archaeon]
MSVNLDAVILSLIIRIIILSPVLWIAGRLLVSRDKAKFTDAIWIVVLGTVIGGIIEYFFIGWTSAIIVLFIWLALVKHFFDCGWLKAFAISIITILLFAAIAVILGLIGFVVWGSLALAL